MRTAPPHTLELFHDEFFDQWKARAMLKDVFGSTAQLGELLYTATKMRNKICSIAWSIWCTVVLRSWMTHYTLTEMGLHVQQGRQVYFLG